ncbi:MAG TPA: hypothetical protein VK095_03980 [Beutenbergiaceae bacterium]|nr:hypothetical protein [Beutenbergiaceae bacterium]
MPEPIPMPSPAASWFLEQAVAQAEDVKQNMGQVMPPGWAGPASRSFHHRALSIASRAGVLAVDLREALVRARLHEQEVRELNSSMSGAAGVV